MSKVFVTGANGKTGRRVVKGLVAKGINVLEGSRKASNPFDWENPETWDGYLNQASIVYINYQPDLAVPQAAQAIGLFVQKAKEAGVQKLLLLSGRGESEAQVCENEVISTGLEYNIIRASWFMENFSENFFLDDILKGKLVLPEVKAKEPFVSAEDIADVAVELITSSQHSNRIFSLTGPALLSFEECINTINEITGKQIVFQAVPMEAYETALNKVHMPREFVWLIKYLFTEVLDGRNEFITHDVEHILHRRPVSFSEYVAKAAKSGIWNS